MAAVAADRDLLFGLLALQNGLIDQGQLVAAFQAWTPEKSRPLADYLVALGHLSPAQRSVVEAMAALHLQAHGGEVEMSLAAVPAGKSALDSLAAVHDPDIQRTLSLVGSARPPADDGDADRTASYAVGTAIADGQRFRVLRPHARGGLGAVFVALDAELNREVALKQILDQHADDPISRARFLLEAEVTGGLEHPGIVPVYGLGAYADGRPYYAMRFIRGDSLKEAIGRFHRDGALEADPGRRSLELRKLLRQFLDVCNAVEYAHSRGVLHRDIKPGNVIVGSHGETLVVDWGLAKVSGQREGIGSTGEQPLTLSATGDPSGTLPGTALGTPAYMSPEQASGDPESLGPHSDVYSLGATLYCLLTGKPPLEGDDIGELLRRVRRGEIRRPRQLDPRIDPVLEAVCLKAMALVPADRYPNVRSLAEDIELWLADQPPRAIREPFGHRMARWERRNRVLIRVGGAAAVSLAAIASVATVVVDSARDAERVQRQKADALHGLAERRNEALKRQTTLLLLDQGLARCERGGVGEGLLWLARSLESAPPADAELQRLIRGNLSAWNERVYGLRALIEHRGKCRARLSPDGTRFATASDDYTARVWDTRDGRPVTAPLLHTDEVNWAVFSPDGTRLVTSCNDSKARIWDSATGELIVPELAHSAWVNYADFSPDGTRVITASNDGYACIWDASSGKKLSSLPHQGKGVAWCVFSPDGSRVATSGDDNAARLWDPITGRELTGPLQHQGSVVRVAFDPAGLRIATAGRDGSARIWDARTGEPLVRPLAHRAKVNSVKFSPDGRLLLTSSDDGIARLWDASTGELARALLGHEGAVLFACFSPTGAFVVTSSQDQTSRVWDVRTGALVGASLRHGNWSYYAEIDRSSRLILSSSRDFTARLWDTAPLQARLTLFAHPFGLRTAQFSPDGRRIAVGGLDGSIWITDLDSGTPRPSGISFPREINSLSFSPDGRLILTGSANSVARVWDARTGRPVTPPLVHPTKLQQAVFSPDGRRVATACTDRFVRIWDAATGEALDRLEHPGNVWSISFGPDGRRLATGCGDRRVRVWDLATGKVVGTPITLATEAIWVAYGPHGKHVFTSGQENFARIWDAGTGEPVGPPLEHKGFIYFAGFSPDGALLVTASMDRTARIWDVATGRPIGPSLDHPGAVWSAMFSPDGRRLLTACENGEARLWDIPPPAGLPAELATDWARFRTGLGLDDRGAVKQLDGPSWASASRQARSLSLAPTGPASPIASASQR
jgi:WD40 repeat protein/tRNA A-37 threonylcarbamoyl transferase component Bud32